MSREKKTQIIARLQEALAKCSVGILTDYRGLNTAEMTALRRKLQESGGEYTVVKNTLARLAAERAGKEKLASAFVGPVAVALGYGDITQPAKILADYIRTARTSLSIKGGFLGDRMLASAEVTAIATLPPKEVLLARAIGQLKSPIYALVGCLTAPMRGIIAVLQARIQQLEVN